MATFFTYPNTVNLQQRGSLSTRYAKLKNINRYFNTGDFQIVEVPGDFIKNKTEEEKTGLALGEMLVAEDGPSYIYAKDNDDVSGLKYIMHTEPELSRRGSTVTTAVLAWYDPEWQNDFFRHVRNIVKFLDKIPYAVEVHPGSHQRGFNSIPGFVTALDYLVQRFEALFEARVFLMIENRTGQIVQSGQEMYLLWDYLVQKHPTLAAKTGFVIDFQQLYTSTRKRFVSELNLIPGESVLGCHVHALHKAPSLTDPIDWPAVAGYLERLPKDRPLHVLPEVHHEKQVYEAYEFCKKVLGL